MRRFVLVRNEDLSGISGTGPVAEGVEFKNGQAIMQWFGKLHAIEVVESIPVLLAIHGHSGRTVIEWLDPPEGH